MVSLFFFKIIQHKQDVLSKALGVLCCAKQKFTPQGWLVS